MKLEKFIDGYKNSKDKTSYVKRHIISEMYIPYADKISFCRTINDVSMHVNGKFIKNTPVQYMLYTLTVFEKYTDLEFTHESVTKEYDALNELGITDIFYAEAPQKEIMEFKTILQMNAEDMYENERSLVSFLETKFEALGLSLDTLAQVVEKLPNNNKRITS